ncbi:fungal-specific transcription factor domain-containing protein [Auriculariales sp. MPI-PUGE-AT-0066]|nr:fungal-specific transcription factor domain-containing protein [Auriculariales sp. MPI-PUGE-AT-0066]
MVASGKKQKLDEAPSPTSTNQQDPLKPIQLQRRRVWRACESCRRKKIKCDGREPTCSQCLASKTNCVWVQTRDRAALSRHYVQELEHRLVQMESLLHQVQPWSSCWGNLQMVPAPSQMEISTPPAAHVQLPVDLGSSNMPLASGSRRAGSEGETDHNACGIHKAVPREAAENDDVVDQFGQLTLDDNGHLRWIGGSSTMALMQSFRDIFANRPQPETHGSSPESDAPDYERTTHTNVNTLYFPAGLGFGQVQALPGVHEVEWPARDLADKLIDAYFERFHFLLPVLDKQSFLADYHRLIEETNDEDDTDAAIVSVIFAVFACAARFVDDPRLAKEVSVEQGGVGMIYYERAMILYYIGQGNPQLAQVQAFVLLASFLCSINCLPRAWLTVGQAVRTAQDLGLHRSPRHLRLKLDKKELRRKVWWCIYVLDRMLAVALGRPLGIEDIDCDVELPLAIDDDDIHAYFDHESNVKENKFSLMTGFIALINLTKKAGLILRTVYGLNNCKEDMTAEEVTAVQVAIDAFDVELTKWCTDLPPAFKSNPVGAKQVTMGAVLCSSYYAILITLHRKVMPTRTAQAITHSTSFAKAVAAARSCIMLAPSIKDAIPASHHLSFFIQYLFSSAVIILLCVINSNPDEAAVQTVMDEVRTCIATLGTMEGRWPGAERCKTMLEELVGVTNQARENAALRMKAEPATPVMADRPAFRRIAKKPTSRPGSRSRPASRVRPDVRLDSPGSTYTGSDITLASPTSASMKNLKRSHSEADRGDTLSNASTSPQQLPPIPQFTYPNSYPANSVEPHLFAPADTQMQGINTHDFAQPFPPERAAMDAFSVAPNWNVAGFDAPREQVAQPSQFIYNGVSGNGQFPMDTRRLSLSVQPPVSGPASAVENGTTTGGTPPRLFDMSGLDFAGLDFVQNFTSGGYLGGTSESADMDHFWQSFDSQQPLQQPFGALAETNGFNYGNHG